MNNSSETERLDRLGRNVLSVIEQNAKADGFAYLARALEALNRLEWKIDKVALTQEQRRDLLDEVNAIRAIFHQ